MRLLPPINTTPPSDLSKVVPDLQVPPTPSHRGSLSANTLTSDPSSTHDTTDGPPLTFVSLKDKLLNILFRAVESEKDPVNVQMLLHALMTFMQDIGEGVCTAVYSIASVPVCN